MEDIRTVEQKKKSLASKKQYMDELLDWDDSAEGKYIWVLHNRVERITSIQKKVMDFEVEGALPNLFST